jgi:ribosome maturation factor RimP
LASIEEKVEKLLKAKIESIGYDLYDVEYSKEGKNYFLRIFIDRPKGIDLQDCEKVSNEISDLLDEADYIKEQYFLEVSSPGIERVLKKEKHLQQNIGKEVNVKLFKKDKNGNKEYQGILKEFDEDSILLETDIKIERKNVAQIKTIYKW